MASIVIILLSGQLLPADVPRPLCFLSEILCECGVEGHVPPRQVQISSVHRRPHTFASRAAAQFASRDESEISRQVEG
jgi:hypothetical protein